MHGSQVPYLEQRSPQVWHIEPARATMSTAITWNFGPTHLTDENIDEVGRLARSASPAVIVLQDAHRPQTARASTIKQLERACPDHKSFLGGTDAPSSEHLYPFLLITLVRKTLCPAL